ncbi:MAG: polysaccharide biosynthesis protein [Candidatus Parcubacteria bacterium]|nr:MAG: polysaccharide biosynthesis protein [Candidatus Pacearchaeota archaeon]GIW65361.1 MAG: polysaccharide biosynthesis protein [Candidatus Parcubacteria bacterium]
MKISLSSPHITPLERRAILGVLETPNLSRGPKVREFEERLASYIGVSYGVAVNSGTSGLHLSIKALGLKEGDEVITTPFSFISSSNCLLMEGIKPVFIDIDPLTYNLNPDLIEEKITPKTKSILPVHIFGCPVEMDKIQNIAKKYKLFVIEDACEAIGAKYKGGFVGKYGNVSVLAFYPNKQITTGEGGMVLTNDENIAELCRSMRCHGFNENRLCVRLGYNYHMDEMSAALGLAQLSRIEEILEKRENIAERYIEKLSGIEEIILPYTPNEVKRSWFVFTIRVTNGKRDKVMNYLLKSGIECKPYFDPPIHLHPLYKERFGYKKGDFPITEKISRESLALPFHNNLKEEDIDYVVDKLKKAIKNVTR